MRTKHASQLRLVWEREDEMDDFAITAAMMQYGGSFVAGLGRLWRQADSENKATLKAAFEKYWLAYEAIAMERADVRMDVMCSWCHGLNSRNGLALTPYCIFCGHRADVPRSHCDCPKCWKPDDVDADAKAEGR